MGAEPANTKTLHSIPALPISFFKSGEIYVGDERPSLVFESSGTTGAATSKHFVREPEIYRKSFLSTFRQFYGNIDEWCILGLLPSYLERKQSSLVMMVDELIHLSKHPQSGFYLHNHDQLSKTLQELEKQEQKTLLIGVTFGLLDFAERYPQQLKNTVVMETGGMKGRRKELTRVEMHGLLMEGLGTASIHGEYGMTELLSQAYATQNGRYYCPPWMKITVRDEEDPLAIRETGRGILQVTDLANIYSCPFIATEDIGMVYADGSFEVWGRVDNSDLRGCSLMAV
ncbi:MAG: hypothetical protein RLZZ28_1843 [Bacteroidota bacterium]